MKVNPSQFAFYLKSSSLSSTEQRAVLQRLLRMNESAIEQLFVRLKADHEAISETLNAAHIKRQQINDDLVRDLKSQ